MTDELNGKPMRPMGAIEETGEIPETAPTPYRLRKPVPCTVGLEAIHCGHCGSGRTVYRMTVEIDQQLSVEDGRIVTRDIGQQMDPDSMRDEHVRCLNCGGKSVVRDVEWK